MAWNRFTDPGFQTGARLSNCGGRGGGLKDCIPATELGITKAYVCKSIKANGLCCSKTAQTVKKGLMVGFWYAKSGGKWILNTAYPSTNAQCN